MSYVGHPFEYDIFVSYAHGDAETNASAMRLWCQHVVKSVRASLASALNTTDRAFDVNIFIDRELQSGAPLTATLREKVQKSALLLVLMNPLYCRKSWCLDELEWFFEQADKDGRGQRQCTVVYIQPVPDADWPKRLRDQREKPVLACEDFLDRDAQLPIGFNNYDLPALKDAIRNVHIELMSKLKELRRQFEARQAYQQATVPPDQPVLYLRARPQDHSYWRTTREELAPHAIVNPEHLPEAFDDDPSSNRSARDGLESTRNATASFSCASARMKRFALR